jgi:small subunit ribosomal protein S6
MADDQTIIYEGLFLFPQATSANLQAAVDHVNELLGRIEADILSLAKWDERRLAYEIKGNKRGVYFLTYFRAVPSRLPALERACNLSELLLRSMIVRADHIPSEQIEAADGREKLQTEIQLKGEDVGTRTEGSGDAESEPGAAVVSASEDEPTSSAGV